MNIEVRNLSRYFGSVKAVNNISFSLKENEIVGFVGPNGAGKTTAMRIMATLDEPQEGDVLMGGVSIFDNPMEARREIGFMPDTLPEYDNMTVREYIDFFGRAFRLRGKALRKAVEDVEDFTGSGQFRNKLLKELSKGMKQRISLARALIHNPRVLILDEPANGLDPRARVELREMIASLGKAGKVILVSSHILLELSEMCTRFLILEKGRLLRGGTVDEISRKNCEEVVVSLKVIDMKPTELLAMLRECEMVKECVESPSAIKVVLAGGEANASLFLKMLIEKNLKVIEFSIQKENLEDVFMDVTKGDLS